MKKLPSVCLATFLLISYSILNVTSMCNLQVQNISENPWSTISIGLLNGITGFFTFFSNGELKFINISTPGKDSLFLNTDILFEENTILSLAYDIKLDIMVTAVEEGGFPRVYAIKNKIRYPISYNGDVRKFPFKSLRNKLLYLMHSNKLTNINSYQETEVATALYTAVITEYTSLSDFVSSKKILLGSIATDLNRKLLYIAVSNFMDCGMIFIVPLNADDEIQYSKIQLLLDNFHRSCVPNSKHRTTSYNKSYRGQVLSLTNSHPFNLIMDKAIDCLFWITTAAITIATNRESYNENSASISTVNDKNNSMSTVYIWKYDLSRNICEKYSEFNLSLTNSTYIKNKFNTDALVNDSVFSILIPPMGHSKDYIYISYKPLNIIYKVFYQNSDSNHSLTSHKSSSNKLSSLTQRRSRHRLRKLASAPYSIRTESPIPIVNTIPTNQPSLFLYNQKDSKIKKTIIVSETSSAPIDIKYAIVAGLLGVVIALLLMGFIIIKYIPDTDDTNEDNEHSGENKEDGLNENSESSVSSTTNSQTSFHRPRVPPTRIKIEKWVREVEGDSESSDEESTTESIGVAIGRKSQNSKQQRVSAGSVPHVGLDDSISSQSVSSTTPMLANTTTYSTSSNDSLVPSNIRHVRGDTWLGNKDTPKAFNPREQRMPPPPLAVIQPVSSTAARPPLPSTAAVAVRPLSQSTANKSLPQPPRLSLPQPIVTNTTDLPSLATLALARMPFRWKTEESSAGQADEIVNGRKPIVTDR